MKTIALIITAFALASCTVSGSYTSATQNFDFNTAIVIPVENCKKWYASTFFNTFRLKEYYHLLQQKSVGVYFFI